MTSRVAWCRGRLARGGLLTALLWSLLCLLAQPAQAWWNSDWSYRMKVVADAGPKGASITDPVGRTQVLIRLHSGNFNFATAKEDGTDLRFVAGDDRTPLHFHMERFDGLVDQVGLVWVDVPDLAPGVATPIYVYWGNKNANAAGDSRTTYDADQLLVYHFAEDNGLPKDSTGYANNALTAGRRDAAGLIGNGLRLDGTAPIQLPKSPSLAIAAGQALSWSLWLHPDAGAAAASAPLPGAPASPTPTVSPGAPTPGAATAGTPAAGAPAGGTPATGTPVNGTATAGNRTAILFSDRDGPSGLTIGIDQGAVYAQVDTPDGTKRTTAGPPITGDGWHLISMIATADHLTVYVDGQARGDVAAALPALAGQAALGGALPVAAAAPAVPTGPPAPGAAPPAAPAAPLPTPGGSPPPAPAAAAPQANFIGQLDEFELSKVARPLGALQTAVASQGPDPKLLTFDVAEQASVFGSGYVGIIVRAVSPDAWVIIGLLGVMSVISWWIMIGKALHLRRVSRINERFRETYRQSVLGQDADAGFVSLGGAPDDTLRNAPLYRLYDIAAEELNGRLRGGITLPDGMLSPQSLVAIRAAVDARLVRENQRLNRAMVLLTIAISGGPFLGLLGTVVGVMITFAAVAQAGDVNINAIAPGISAALLATVAGLTVAIPALFGYNYLLVRVREVTSDMSAFAEEMVARIGEGRRAPQRKAAE